MKILAIDPGNIESAYVVLNDDLKPIEFGKLENYHLKHILMEIINKHRIKHVAIEHIASMGMAVGQTVFTTCIWIGRFTEGLSRHIDIVEIKEIYRRDEKINLCGSMKAKDANIRQALIDRFGIVGTKRFPGWFHGVSKDVWSAVATGVTYYDLYLSKKERVVG